MNHHCNHEGCENDRKSNHSEQTKRDICSRLNRIEGQVRAVKNMVERDIYCDDVLNQIASIQAALNSTGKLLLDKHIKSCVKERILMGDDEVFDEVLKTINKLIK
jgi:DNA-binding FrmR family transcriptional regulator